MPSPSSRPSFIPKERESFNLPDQGRSTALDPLVLLGIAVFLAVLAVWVGVVLYGRYAEAQTAVLERTLNQEKQLLNDKVVDHLLATDRQFSASRRLVDQHLAPSHIFTILEERTIDGLRYTSFSYQGEPGGGQATVSLDGEAHNFSTVVEQSEVLEQSPRITTSEFSEVNKDPEAGNVRFTLELTLPMDDLRYGSVLAGEESGLNAEEAGTSSVAEEVAQDAESDEDGDRGGEGEVGAAAAANPLEQ